KRMAYLVFAGQVGRHKAVANLALCQELGHFLCFGLRAMVVQGDIPARIRQGQGNLAAKPPRGACHEGSPKWLKAAHKADTSSVVSTSSGAEVFLTARRHSLLGGGLSGTVNWRSSSRRNTCTCTVSPALYARRMCSRPKASLTRKPSTATSTSPAERPPRCAAPPSKTVASSTWPGVTLSRASSDTVDPALAQVSSTPCVSSN